MDGKKYLFIDTAGIRRKSKVYENIEKYSVIRAYASVEKADVVLTVIDVTEGISSKIVKLQGLHMMLERRQ